MEKSKFFIQAGQTSAIAHRYNQASDLYLSVCEYYRKKLTDAQIQALDFEVIATKATKTEHAQLAVAALALLLDHVRTGIEIAELVRTRSTPLEFFYTAAEEYSSAYRKFYTAEIERKTKQGQ